MNFETICDVIRERRAVRRYRSEPVPAGLLDTLLETAMWAPSAHNRQPWRFAVMGEQQWKRELAEQMGERLRRDRLADGDPHEAIEADVDRSIRRITGAPVVIVVCLTMEDMDSYPDQRRMEAERMMAVQSVAMAAQNLWLLAHGAGLGACWLCAPLFVPALVREVLALPNSWEPQGLMTLGWPAVSPTKERQPWRSRVRFLDKIKSEASGEG